MAPEWHKLRLLQVQANVKLMQGTDRALQMHLFILIQELANYCLPSQVCLTSDMPAWKHAGYEVLRQAGQSTLHFVRRYALPSLWQDAGYYLDFLHMR